MLFFDYTDKRMGCVMYGKNSYNGYITYCLDYDGGIISGNKRIVIRKSFSNCFFINLFKEEL
jgi:hypothetical protein